MTKPEQEYVTEINRLKEAISKTKSEYLKRDYSKRIKRMNSELKQYRKYMYG